MPEVAMRAERSNASQRMEDVLSRPAHAIDSCVGTSNKGGLSRRFDFRRLRQTMFTGSEPWFGSERRFASAAVSTKLCSRKTRTMSL